MNILLRLAPRLTFKSRAAKLAAAGVLIVAVAFAVGAFVVAPLLIDAALQRFASSTPERDMRVERIAVNPFNLTVDLSGAAVDDPAVGASLTFDRVRLNFGFVSLLGRVVVLDEIGIEAPHLRVAAAADGGARPLDSLRELVRAGLPTTRPLRVERLTISDGRIDAAGSFAAPEPQVEIESISVTATNLLSDAAEAGELALSARERDGAWLRIDGQLALAASASSGRFAVQGVDLERLRPWLGPRVGAVRAAGSVAAEGDYSLSFAPGAEALRLSGVEASLGTARLDLESGASLVAEGLDIEADVEVAAAGESWTARAGGRFEAAAVQLADGDGGAVLEMRSAAGSGVEIPAGLAGTEPLEIAIDALRIEGAETRIPIGRPENPDAAEAPPRGNSEARERPENEALADDWMFAARRAAAEALAGDGPVATRRIEIVDGRFDLVDTRFSPPVVLQVSSVDGTLSAAADMHAAAADADGDADTARGEADADTVADGVGERNAVARAGAGAGGQAGAAIVVDLTGQLGDTGTIAIAARAAGALGAAETRVELTASQVDAGELSRYFARFAGREPVAGRLDVDLEYRLGGTLHGRVRVGASHLRFAADPGDVTPAAGLDDVTPAAGPDDVTAAAGPDDVTTAAGRDGAKAARIALPLDLALALLEDPEGRADVEVPLEDGASVVGAVVAALEDFVREVAAEPFEVLGRLAGRKGDALESVTFEPGEAAPNPAGLDALIALGGALSQRPAAALRIVGRADPELDRDALAAQQVELHVSLATAGPTIVARPQPVDFTSPRAQDILEEFANERLTPETLATIASYFTQDANGRVVEEERTSYYRALFDALVEREAIPENGLSRLARYRAQAIVDVLADQGVAAERTTLGDPIIADAAAAPSAPARQDGGSNPAPAEPPDPAEPEPQPDAAAQALAAQVVALPLELLPMSTLDSEPNAAPALR